MQLVRQYTKTMAMEAGTAVGENKLFVFAYLLRLLRVLAMLAIWLRYNGRPRFTAKRNQ